MTEEQRAPEPARRPSKLALVSALVGLLALGYLAAGMLAGFVRNPLGRGERIRGFFLVQLLMLAMIPLLVPLLSHLFPRRVGRLPRWAKLLGVLLAPLPVCFFPVPALFQATVDRMANQREIELYKDASAPLRAALQACRRDEGRYPENPEQCLNATHAKEIAVGGRRRPDVRYHSEGRRYALGFRGSDPDRDRSAVILFWSDSGAWSWHDYSGFAGAVRGQPAREALGVSCMFVEEWSCRAPAD